MIYDLCIGFGETLRLFTLTLVFAIPLGFILAFLSMTKFKPISYLTKFFVWVIRGTPLLLQCIVIASIPDKVFGVSNKDLTIMLGIDKVAELLFLFVVIGFVINYACYFSVIIEGGIRNIPIGQHEAGKVLGMTKWQIFKHVVLMQVVRKITAPMSNEIITLVKDTALANALSVIEIIAVANGQVKDIISLSPLLYAALFYLAFSGLLTILFHFIDKKLSYYSV